MTAPYLSVAITGRNDNYGENFLTRINTFVQSLDRQAKLYPGLMELVITEWNPLPDKKSLSEVLEPTTALPVRIITVDPETHATLNTPTPVLEYHGKNVGIRRARGEFVLSTNPDILLSDEMIQEFSRRWLRKDCVYRTDRYDYVGTGIEQIAVDNLIEFAKSKVFQAHLNNGSVDVSAGATDLPASDPLSNFLHTNGAGDFILASREAFFTARGLWESTQQKWHMDSYSLIRLVSSGLKQIIMTGPMCAFHMDHARGAADAAWDAALATKVAPALGNTNWGLGNINLKESDIWPTKD